VIPYRRLPRVHDVPGAATAGVAVPVFVRSDPRAVGLEAEHPIWLRSEEPERRSGKLESSVAGWLRAEDDYRAPAPRPISGKSASFAMTTVRSCWSGMLRDRVRCPSGTRCAQSPAALQQAPHGVPADAFDLVGARERRRIPGMRGGNGQRRLRRRERRRASGGGRDLRWSGQ